MSHRSADRAVETPYAGKHYKRLRVWKIYLVLGILTALVFYLMPGTEHGIFYIVLYNLTDVSAVVAVVVGVRMNRPDHPLPWYLFAAGLLMFVAGDSVLLYYKNILQTNAPVPSLADAFWLGGYLILAVALALLIRSRRAPEHDRAGLIDATIIATGTGVLSWVYLMSAYAGDETLLLLERCISISYPLMDILLLAVAVRLAVAPGMRTPAYRLLGLSLAYLLFADTIFVKMTLDGTYYTGSFPDLWYLFSYVFWAPPRCTRRCEPYPSQRPIAGRSSRGGALRCSPRPPSPHLWYSGSKRRATRGSTYR